MSQGGPKDDQGPVPRSPGSGAPQDDLLTSDDIFGDMLDSAPQERAPALAPPAPGQPPVRKAPIKVQVAEPGAARKMASPLADSPGTGGEALPDDVAALLDAFSEPGEAATRAAAREEADAQAARAALANAAPQAAPLEVELPEVELPEFDLPPADVPEIDLDLLVDDPETPSSPALEEPALESGEPFALEPPPAPWSPAAEEELEGLTDDAREAPATRDPDDALEEEIDLEDEIEAPATEEAPWAAAASDASDPMLELMGEPADAPPPSTRPAADTEPGPAPAEAPPSDLLLDELLLDDEDSPAETAQAPLPAASVSPPVPSPAPGRRPTAQESLQELLDLQRPTARTGTKFQAATPRWESGPSIDLAALAAEALGEAPPKKKLAPEAPAATAAARPPRPVTPEPTSPGGVEYGAYRLLEKVAVGGMAEVFRAKRSGVEGFEKVVAVKRILSHLSDNKEFVDMFIDEAKMVAGLAHPNIVQIYDLGKIEKSYYIAMEYVHGRDLRTILRRAREKSLRVPLDLTTFVVSRVCSSLEYAHRAKDDRGRAMLIVHRDISPQNILISFEGDVKLTDFGIAKAATKASSTDRGALRGKLLYMSPEQAWGKPIDRRSDIFSLGIVFYEMLTDQKPFLGNSEMSILEMVRESRVAPPTTLNPRIPEKLEKVVMKALARDPEARYQDAAEMYRDLERVLHEWQPPTALGLARFLEVLFDDAERGGPAPSGGHPPHEERSGERVPLEMEFETSEPLPLVEEPVDGDTVKDPMSIQKLLKRFGIK